MGHGLAGRILSDLLRGKSGALARAFEANASGSGPAQKVPMGIGDSHLGVIERGQDMGNAAGNILGVLGLDDLFRIRVFRQEFSGGRSDNGAWLDRLGSFSAFGGLGASGFLRFGGGLGRLLSLFGLFGLFRRGTVGLGFLLTVDPSYITP